MKRLIVKILRLVEKKSCYYLGKGFGSISIEKEVAGALSALSGPPRIVLDIGANVGKYTEEILRRFPDTEVHLFEPIPQNVKILKEKFQSFPKVIINEVAVSDTNGNAILYSDSVGSSLSSLQHRKLDHFQIDMSIETRVETIKIETYHANVLNSQRIDLVKIDIEGLELKALAGFGKSILSCNLVQFEFGGCNIDTRTYFQDFWYFFNSNRFKVSRISPIGLVGVTHYLEEDENFRTTNYLALNVNFKEAI